MLHNSPVETILDKDQSKPHLHFDKLLHGNIHLTSHHITGKLLLKMRKILNNNEWF